MRLKLRRAYLIARQRMTNGIQAKDAAIIAAELFGLNYRQMLIVRRELEKRKK